MHRKGLTAKGVILALLFGASSLVAQQPQQPQPTVTQAGQPTMSELMARGQVEGQSAAESVGTGGWMAGGVVTGLLTGLIGTVVIWAVAGSSDVSVPADRRIYIVEQPAVYQQSYQAGYGQQYGPDAQVLAPAEVRAEVVRRLRLAARAQV
ncbi:MAG: hypothetical protein WD801_10960 [Gemmatimonadaceae bacterium]